MNHDQLAGAWKQVHARLKIRWAKLNRDDKNIIDGRRRLLLGRIQTLRGNVREQSRRDLSEWRDRNGDMRRGVDSGVRPASIANGEDFGVRRRPAQTSPCTLVR